METRFEKIINELLYLQGTGDWEVSDYDLNRPPKEIAPKDGMRQFVPGDHLRMILHFKKNGA